LARVAGAVVSTCMRGDRLARVTDAVVSTCMRGDRLARVDLTWLGEAVAGGQGHLLFVFDE
jgi:hypothetical protein